MENSKLIERGSKTLIVSFAGKNNIGAFEFYNILEEIAPNVDRYFVFDKEQCWYHKGINKISTNVETTVAHLKLLTEKYTKTIFIGCSMGGYAAILFGSLLNVTSVIAFLPQTTLTRHMQSGFDKRYVDTKKFINKITHYFLYGPNIDKLKFGLHSKYHCEHIDIGENVHIEYSAHLNLKKLRDRGVLEKLLLHYIRTEVLFSINKAY